MPINRLPSKQEKLERMFEFTNDLVDILGNIEAGKCDTIDFYCRAFEFMWGAKLLSRRLAVRRRSKIFSSPNGFKIFKVPIPWAFAFGLVSREFRGDCKLYRRGDDGRLGHSDSLADRK